MARRRQMRRPTGPARKQFAWQVGGMSAKGDPSMKDGKVILARNVFVRPGGDGHLRADKRPGWLRDTNSTGQACSQFLPFTSKAGVTTLLGRFGSAGAGKIMKRSSGGAWSITSTLDDVGSGGYAGYFGDNAYFSYSDDSVDYLVGKFDGTTFTANAIAETLGGFADCVGFLDRLFLGYVIETVNNIAEPNISNDFATGPGTYWTLSSVTQSSGSLTWSAAAGTAISANFSAVGASGEWRTFSITAQNTTADGSLPGYLTISIENTAGTATYGSEEITISSRDADPLWQRFAVRAWIPASTAYRLKIAGGHVDRANNLITIKVVDTTDDKGVMVTAGRFFHTMDVAGALQSPSPTYSYPYRIIWSEPGEPTNWRATGYIDLNEEPGPIIALRATEDRLYAFKENAIWIFRGTADPDFPLQRERIIRGVGAIHSKTVKFYEGSFYFIGQSDVYRMSLSGEIEPLSGVDKQEDLFPVSLTIGPGCLEIDSDRKQVWIYTQTGKIDVFDLRSGQWSQQTLTGASDSELQIRDLWYGKPTGESNREMYAACAYTESDDIVKLRASQTQDNITGTARDVVAKLQLQPIGSVSPRTEFTIEEVGLRHTITSQDTSDLIRISVSTDGGNTWTYYIEDTLPTANLAQTQYDLKREPYGIESTAAPLQIIEIKHTGYGGPNYFRVTGGDYTLKIHGREIYGDRSAPSGSNF